MYLPNERFSLWCDFVEKNFLAQGFLELIKDGNINGATSNPAIFKTAFLTSAAYQDAKKSLSGKPPKEIYEALAIADIQQAAKVLLPQYEADDDGFISIEVDPFLSDDTKGTIAEGKRLFAAIGMPNVMIKVPATKAGFDAMETLMREGINVNATLVFSLTQAQGCLDAFEAGGNACVSGRPKGVISVFVSRFDRMLDPVLTQQNMAPFTVGVVNAMGIYNAIEKRGLSHVRCLFASTGVKGEGVSADHYVQALLFPNAINTAPLETLHAFLNVGAKAPHTPLNEGQIEAYFQEIADAGVVMETVYETLMNEGLEAFHQAFRELLNTLR
ncbi:MAG: transaldolase [Campylobacterales bacterium]|nr:transaldolase [Campylobacterales bacterium]